MVPGLWPGDVVEVARTSPASPIQSGELVLVARAGRLFCHRVVEIVRDREVDLLRTRGDALEDCDPLTPLSDVLGVVVRVERHRLRTCRWRLAEFTQRVRRLAAVLNR